MSGRLLVLPDRLGVSPLFQLMEIHVFARDGVLPGWFPFGEPTDLPCAQSKRTLAIPSVLALLHTDFRARRKGLTRNPMI